MSERKLVGFENFERFNPLSDKFPTHKFHSVEFYTGDSINNASRFGWALGMKMVGKSDLTTGNKLYSSIVMQSNDIVFAFSAPYNNTDEEKEGCSALPYPSYDQDKAFNFFRKHGLAVYAIGISVDDAYEAHRIAMENGAVNGCDPYTLHDDETNTDCHVAEVKAYGDVVLRFISGTYEGPFLPLYERIESPDVNYGLQRIDHMVGNCPKLFEVTDYLFAITGWHEFAEFTAEDVGTVDSGLNSMVVSNNNEMILLPINEPTHGTKRKSQIQTYIEQNNGPGVQHIALKTDDIFHTMRELRKRTRLGGFDFMPKPDHGYYERVPGRIGENTLTPEQLVELEELGLLADADDQGVLLQIFTKPLGDRLTIFIEIIQRIGCDTNDEGEKVEQAAGCGGFGKGNFSELFKSIEEYERQIEEHEQKEKSK